MKAILLTLALSSSDISIEITNFFHEDGIANVVLSVSNNGNSDAKNIFIDCPIYSKNGKAIDIGRALITSLSVGQTKYDKASIVTNADVDKVSCYVDKVR